MIKDSLLGICLALRARVSSPMLLRMSPVDAYHTKSGGDQGLCPSPPVPYPKELPVRTFSYKFGATKYSLLNIAKGSPFLGLVSKGD